MSELPDGRIAYELRHPGRDGTTHVVFTGVELLEKRAALTPAPRGNLCRYHGVLAPGAKWRSSVVRDRAPAVRCARMKQPTPGKANGHDCSGADRLRLRNRGTAAQSFAPIPAGGGTDDVHWTIRARREGTVTFTLTVTDGTGATVDTFARTITIQR